MRRRQGAVVLGAVLLFGPAAFAQSAGGAGQGGGDAYRLAALTFRLPAGESVGSKRSGALCLPAGRIAWREARPEGDEAREAVGRALGGAGLAVRPADVAAVDDDTPARFRVAGEVRGLKLSACVPPGGLGRLINHSHTVKGEGGIAVRWTVTERSGQPTTRTSCVAFTYRGARRHGRQRRPFWGAGTGRPRLAGRHDAGRVGGSGA